MWGYNIYDITITIDQATDADVLAKTTSITRTEQFNLTYCWWCSWCYNAYITTDAWTTPNYQHTIHYDPTRTTSADWYELPWQRWNGGKARFSLWPSYGCSMNIH